MEAHKYITINLLKKGFTKSLSAYMLYFITIFLILQACDGSGKELALVKNGKSNSVIIIPSEINELQTTAIQDFTKTISRSSGANIPVMTEEKADMLNGKTIRIILGPSPATDKLGYSSNDLKEEEFRIISRDNIIVILTHDLERFADRSSMVTTWAFSYLLDHFVGVRWLWPGETGTVVPQLKNILIPEMDIRIQPELLSRRLRSRDNPDITLWKNHHQAAGQRVNYKFGHSFRANQDNGEWWDRLHSTHPEYFAKNPSGQISYTNNNKEFFQLCISNPDVTDEIVRLWEQAGKPDFWDVTPNDGSGFCTCDNCRALDLEYGDVSYTKEEIWYRPAHVSLTDRYVWHWNKLIRIMREKNPDVKIGVYYYSAYRNPPKKLKLEKGIVGLMVHGYDFSFWKAWKEAGAEEIGLRPNWWHMGGNGPHLPLHLVGQYIETARKEGMILIDMDSLMEYWAAQGPYYYLVARLIARPDLNTEDIITEYCRTFGKAADDIRRYLNFWEEYHLKVAYNVPAGGALSQDPEGLYETISTEKFSSVMHPLSGHWKTMPYIYNQEILKEAHTILDQAEKKEENQDIRLRISYLRDGINQVSKVVAFLEAPKNKQAVNPMDNQGNVIVSKGNGLTDKQFEALKDLNNFSLEMEKKYAYWGRNGIDVMKRRGVIGASVSLDGL